MKKTIFLLLILTISSYAQFEKNSIEKLSISGLNPTISITIGGAFVVNGSFSALPQERVDQFVSRIFNTYKAAKIEKATNLYFINEIEKEFNKYARRNIKIIRSNGERLTIDLEKFRLTGDFNNNPFLKNDDLIVFPDFNPDIDIIYVSGAVNFPLSFQYVEGDRLSDALLFARGINKSYEKIKDIVISRLDNSGEKEDVIICSMKDTLMALNRGDRIWVRAEESMKKAYKVTVNGEVYIPGEVPITKNSTTLRDVLLKVGGVKESADLNRAELIRGTNVFKSLMFSQENEKLMMSRMANIAPEDSLSFTIDNTLRFMRGNGVINFEKVLDPKNKEGDFIVKDGDFIFIPEKLNLVYIFGQVNNPGYVGYSDTAKVDYYLRQAGGTAKTAKDDIYLIKGKSRSWIRVEENNYTIEPGDYLWIPKEPVRTFNYYLQQIGSVATVIGTVATLIVLLIQVNK